jgi:hypothetical protein
MGVIFVKASYNCEFNDGLFSSGRHWKEYSGSTTLGPYWQAIKINLYKTTSAKS